MAKAKQVEEKEGLISVTRTVLGRQTGENRRVKIRPFVTNTATVSVKFGATIPTVEFGGVRVDVMIACPCYVEEIAPVYKQVRDLTDKLIDKEAARLTGEDQDNE